MTTWKTLNLGEDYDPNAKARKANDAIPLKLSNDPAAWWQGTLLLIAIFALAIVGIGHANERPVATMTEHADRRPTSSEISAFRAQQRTDTQISDLQDQLDKQARDIRSRP